ncbi:RES family NAD+ phosphorylase [Candidatus Thiodiazotropha sp. CDECU1]|uniref:RES family NAD+ phosphorylase n=1 Tax=Candidatus Thiodiazotropha sp. CDECU1 TaxID=3065865 RepID=UPI00292EAAC6|nr:RES family NAD+ phosphorylase [Candidatus Thiodiazotropha sp. CDECU1]
MLSGWRIAAPEFASSPDEMMSGEGAYLFGGRWNSKGVRVVYLGSSLAQAAMELLIHLGRADILNDYYKMKVSFPEALVQHIALADLPEEWREPTMASSVQAVGDQWVTDRSSLILQVPSATVSGEYNYVFNPLHPDATKARFSAITKFTFDPRLVK